MLFAKQSLLLINENGFDSRTDRKFTANFNRFDNAYRGNKFFENVNRDDNNRSKSKAYVVNEKNKIEITNEVKEIFFDNNVYYNQNLKYYNSNNFADDENDEKSKIHFVVAFTEFACRRYNKRFAFNNRLHLYLRTGCSRLQKLFSVANEFADNKNSRQKPFFASNNEFTSDENNRQKSFVRRKPFANTFYRKFFTNVFVFFIDVIKVTKTTDNVDNSKLFVIRSNVDVFQNVDIDFNYRD